MTEISCFGEIVTITQCDVTIQFRVSDLHFIDREILIEALTR